MTSETKETVTVLSWIKEKEANLQSEMAQTDRSSVTWEVLRGRRNQLGEIIALAAALDQETKEPQQTTETLPIDHEAARILVALLGPIALIPGSADLYERLLKFAYPTGRTSHE